MVRQPTPEDKFSFGLWTVGWTGTDPFGAPTRPALDPWSRPRSSASSAPGESPSTTTTSSRSTPTRPRGAAGRAVQGRHGRDRPRDPDGHDEPLHPPGLQGRRLHLQRPRGPSLRAAQGPLDVDLAAELGAETFVMWGGREGAEYDGVQGRARGARPVQGGSGHARRVRQGLGLRPAVRARAQAERAARRHPAAHGRPRAGVHHRAGARRHGRPQPRGRPRADGRASTSPTASPRRCGTASCSTSTSTASAGIKYDQDLVFGHGDLLSAPSSRSTCSRTGSSAPRRPAYDGPAPLRLQAVAHRGHGRGVGVGRGEHAHLPAAQGEGRGLPRRPRGARGHLADAGVTDLATPTLDDGRDAGGLPGDGRRIRRREGGRAGLRLRAPQPARRRAPLGS